MTEYENRLKIEYTISDCKSEDCVTKAQTIQVAVDKASGEMCFCSPKVFLDKVRACLGK
jgi:acyl-CoA thioester hydrolase